MGTAAMTTDEIDRRIMLTKQINGLPTGPACREEVEKTIEKYFKKETAEDEKDAKTEKNSKFLAASYNAESIVYNDCLMILYDVSMLPEVQAICKFQDWPALKKYLTLLLYARHVTTLATCLNLSKLRCMDNMPA